MRPKNRERCTEPTVHDAERESKRGYGFSCGTHERGELGPCAPKIGSAAPSQPYNVHDGLALWEEVGVAVGVLEPVLPVILHVVEVCKVARRRRSPQRSGRTKRQGCKITVSARQDLATVAAGCNLTDLHETERS